MLSTWQWLNDIPLGTVNLINDNSHDILLIYIGKEHLSPLGLMYKIGADVQELNAAFHSSHRSCWTSPTNSAAIPLEMNFWLLSIVRAVKGEMQTTIDLPLSPERSESNTNDNKALSLGRSESNPMVTRHSKGNSHSQSEATRIRPCH